MDLNRFDALTRWLALGISRRNVTTGLAALTGFSLTQLQGAEAKKKSKKKKKRKKKKRSNPSPSPRPVVQCVDDVQQACPADNCCAGLTCGRNDCAGGDVCLRDVNGFCEGPCDCLENLECSEVTQSCRPCNTRGEACPNGECCLIDNECGNNGLDTDNVCCGSQDAACQVSADCCTGFGCDERGGSTCQVCAREASAVRSLVDQEECNVDGDCCRADYFCEGSGCLNPLLDVCCGRPQASCEIDCDCCGALSNCPRAIAGETNACGVSGVCCLFEGAPCVDLCDCCEGFTCDGGACAPN